MRSWTHALTHIGVDLGPICFKGLQQVVSSGHGSGRGFGHHDVRHLGSGTGLSKDSVCVYVRKFDASGSSDGSVFSKSRRAMTGLQNSVSMEEGAVVERHRRKSLWRTMDSDPCLRFASVGVTERLSYSDEHTESLASWVATSDNGHHLDQGSHTTNNAELLLQVESDRRGRSAHQPTWHRYVGPHRPSAGRNNNLNRQPCARLCLEMLSQSEMQESPR